MTMLGSMRLIEPADIYFWEITGQTSSESSGGEATIYVMTTDFNQMPDPDEALRVASPGCRWCLVSSIRLVCSFAAAWDVDEAGPVASAIALLAAALKDDCDSFGRILDYLQHMRSRALKRIGKTGPEAAG